MDSMYAKYLKERTDDGILENQAGFATYRILNGKSLYIVDIYILPEFRKSGEASRMADLLADIGRVAGCTEMLGTVNPSAKNSTDNLRVLIAYGMKLSASTDNVIIFKKEL